MSHGLHIIADLHSCVNHKLLFELNQTVQDGLIQAIGDVGLTPLVPCFYQFHSDDGTPDGYTGGVILAESHLMVHTWPWEAKVNACVYVCNYSRDNSARAEKVLRSLIELFGSNDPRIQRVWRT